MKNIAKLQPIIICIAVFLMSVYWVVSQDVDDEPAHDLRHICIEAIGCLQTPLDDEALNVQFGTELARFEAGGDFILRPSEWLFQSHVNSGEECGEFENGPNLIGNFIFFEATENDDTIIINNTIGTSSTYTRIGKGIYMGTEYYGDALTFIETLEFLIIVEENETIQTIRFSNRMVEDIVDNFTSVRCYSFLSSYE